MGRALCGFESSRVGPFLLLLDLTYGQYSSSDEIMKAAEKNPPPATTGTGLGGRPTPVSLRDPGPTSTIPRPGQGPPPPQPPLQQPIQQRPPPQHSQSIPIPGSRPPAPYTQPQPPRGYPPGQGET
jgi:hypothetical protein